MGTDGRRSLKEALLDLERRSQSAAAFDGPNGPPKAPLFDLEDSQRYREVVTDEARVSN
jgi:hypothetical protein